MTSRNLSTARSSSRTNTQSLYEARPATIHRPYPNSSTASTSYQSTRRTAAPAPPTEEQRQSGNILRQKALRAGQVHGSSSNLSSSSLSSSRDAKIRANRSNEDSSVGSKARPGKDVSPGIEMGGNRDLGIAFEDNEIVKRDANGEYESFLTVGGQVYEDVNLGGEGMSDGTETSESAKQRDRELLELCRSQRGNQIDLADMHAANLAYLKERTSALDDDSWMYESENPTRD